MRRESVKSRENFAKIAKMKFQKNMVCLTTVFILNMVMAYSSSGTPMNGRWGRSCIGGSELILRRLYVCI